MRWTDERRGGVQQNKAAFISPGCNGEITACRRCLKSALAELLFSVQWMWFGVTHTLMEGRRGHWEHHFTSKAPQFSSFPPNHRSSFIKNPSLPSEKKRVPIRIIYPAECDDPRVNLHREQTLFTCALSHFEATFVQFPIPALFTALAELPVATLHVVFLLYSVLQTQEHNHTACNLNSCVYPSFLRLASWKYHNLAHLCKAFASLPVFNNTVPAFQTLSLIQC